MSRYVAGIGCLLLVAALLFGCDRQPQTSGSGTSGDSEATGGAGKADETGTAGRAAGNDAAAEQPQAEDANAETANPAGDAERLETNEQTAADDLSRFLTLVKERDVTGVQSFLAQNDQREQWTVELAAKVIEGFAGAFDLATLDAVLNPDGLAMVPDYHQYQFLLIDREQDAVGEADLLAPQHLRSVVLRYEQETGRTIIHSPYVRYYPYAEDLAVGYVELIRAEKAEELALYMNADDLDIPVWVAEQTIEAYKKQFELTSMTVRYEGEFRYTVEDRLGNSHVIKVIYGDGLMGIRDDFQPPFSG